MSKNKHFKTGCALDWIYSTLRYQFTFALDCRISNPSLFFVIVYVIWVQSIVFPLFWVNNLCTIFESKSCYRPNEFALSCNKTKPKKRRENVEWNKKKTAPYWFAIGTASQYKQLTHKKKVWPFHFIDKIVAFYCWNWLTHSSERSNDQKQLIASIEWRAVLVHPSKQI